MGGTRGLGSEKSRQSGLIRSKMAIVAAKVAVVERGDVSPSLSSLPRLLLAEYSQDSRFS